MVSSGSVVTELRAADEDLVPNEGEEPRVDLNPKTCQFTEPLFGKDAQKQYPRTTFKVLFTRADVVGEHAV